MRTHWAKRNGIEVDVVATYYKGGEGWGWRTVGEILHADIEWEEYKLIVPHFDHNGEPKPVMVPLAELFVTGK